MGVTFIAPQGTYTAPAKLVTKEITENGTYDATDDSANGYSSVTVNVEGGGGSSDFSTAEVTSSANSEENIGITAITEIGPNKETVAETSLSGGRTGTAVLYQGHQYINISPVITVTVVSGSAEVVEEIDPMFGTMHFLDIKGDCTILVKPSE